jgi:CBS domain-containing protein
VLRGKSVVGVISMTDIADLLVNVPEPVTIDGDSLLDQRSVGEAMSRDVISVTPSTSVQSAAAVMRKRGVHRLLVMEDDKLAGIVSALDIARAVSERGIAGHTGIRLDPCCDEPSPWITI